MGPFKTRLRYVPLLLGQKQTSGRPVIWHLVFINMSTCELWQVQQVHIPLRYLLALRRKHSETSDSPTERVT